MLRMIVGSGVRARAAAMRRRATAHRPHTGQWRSTVSPAIDGSAIDDVLSKAVSSGAVPHVAAIAADRDGVIYEGGAGVRIAGRSDEPVTTGTQFRITFDNRNLNLTGLAELVLAVLITQMDVFRNLFGTADLTLDQWGLSLLPALVLIILWEIGKLIARRVAGHPQEAAAV
jgi:hypothetical protein